MSTTAGQLHVDLTTGSSADRDNKLKNGSFASNSSGIAALQQNNGNGNVVSTSHAVAGSTSGGTSVDNVSQTVNLKNSTVTADSITDNGSSRNNTINNNGGVAGVGAGYSGLANVQQNNGDGNLVNNGTAVAFAGDVTNGVTQDVFITDDDGSVTTVDAPTSTIGSNADRDNTVSDSTFNNASGVVTLQQNNGDANAMQVATAVTFADSASSVDQTVDLDNTVDSTSTTVDNSADLDNTVDGGSFNGTSGVSTTQQNNGNGNNIAAGTAVTASLGDPVSQVTLNGSTSSNTVTVTDNGSSPANMTNDVTNSYDNVSGVTTVQQNNGSGNNIQSAISVSANLGN